MSWLFSVYDSYAHGINTWAETGIVSGQPEANMVWPSEVMDLVPSWMEVYEDVRKLAPMEDPHVIYAELRRLVEASSKEGE